MANNTSLNWYVQLYYPSIVIIVFFKVLPIHSEDLTVILLFFIIFFLPPLLKLTGHFHFVTYFYETWYMISVNEKLFEILGHGLNIFALRSYLPKHRKPWYHEISETIIDRLSNVMGKMFSRIRQNFVNVGLKWCGILLNELLPFEICQFLSWFITSKR